MPTNPLPNYVRTFRKRVGFSQEEIAYLLGTQTGAQVCRYERFARKPSLETAWAFEVMFRASAKELFGGDYQRVEARVVNRARWMMRKLVNLPANRKNERKLALLKTICSSTPAASNQKP